MIPPGPLLQVQPHQELQDYCAAQQQDVNTYGWVDQQSGVVRIPVERAMELILAEGLPARAASEATGPAVRADGRRRHSGRRNRCAGPVRLFDRTDAGGQGTRRGGAARRKSSAR